MKHVIEYLMLTRNDLIFVLFEKGHERYENYIRLFSGHTVMKAHDPSTKEFNGSGIFSKINAALYMMGKEEIKWYTPNYS
jgi:uracil DNA glycosylase